MTRRQLLHSAAAAGARGSAPAIRKIEVFSVPYPVTAHFKFFTKPERPSVLVKMTAEDGSVGWGQSVPIPTWSYETLESVMVTIEKYLAPVLIDRDPFDVAGAHAAMNRAIAPSFSTGMPIAKAGVDLALHDLAGKLRGQSLAERWGRKSLERIALSWTVNPRTIEETEKLVEEGRARGYKNFNVKVAPDAKFDLEMCGRVRKLAPNAFLWADANGGYDTATALQVAPKLAAIGVNVFEQPVAANRLSGFRELKKQGALPILMDEGLVSSVELVEFIRLGLLDGVAMKPARTAGLWDAKKQIEIVQDAGLLFLGSGLTDPDLALAAALQLYGAYELKFPAALNGPQFLTGSFLKQPLVVRNGEMVVPSGPGLGVEIDETRDPGIEGGAGVIARGAGAEAGPVSHPTFSTKPRPGPAGRKLTLMIPAEAKQRIHQLVGPRGYLDRPEDLTLYEYDGSPEKARPEMVVFPRSTKDVVEIVKIARDHSIPVTGRGAGTGLSGGSIPREGGILVVFSRMNRILKIDLENERAVVEPGVVNLDITLAVQKDKYFFAPDPSSQKACTVGGNVAENAGGPHTLAYGVTTNHVLGIEVVLPDGSVVSTGGKEPDCPGYDLTGLLTGSEGTMALVTKVVVRLMRQPEAVKTVLAIYESAEDAGRTVTEITAHALTPVAVEMLDGVMLRMVEEATHAGYPMDAAAVLLIEFEGLREAVEEQVEGLREVCQACNAREFRVARSAEERELLWKGRKNAFGAIGRVSPFFLVQDGVVPRTQIAPTLRFIAGVSQNYGLTISNIFHAGDGNMHPIILFDMRKPGDLEKAQQAGFDILRHCIAVGGSITGEHGVGMEKMELMKDQFSEASLEVLAGLKRLFDPDCRFNPGKMLPTGRGCLEIRRPPPAAGAAVN